MRADDEEADSYVVSKFRERGYPGLGNGSKIGSLSGGHLILSMGEEMNGVDDGKSLTISNEPAVWLEVTSDTTARLEFENIPNADVNHIIRYVLQPALQLWMKKSADYGGTSGGLGARAPFVDIWRKVIKLKRSLWYGEKLAFEQNEELLQDLIGTSLNILGELRES